MQAVKIPIPVYFLA